MNEGSACKSKLAFIAVIIKSISRVVAETKKMKIGSPLDRSTQV
jgi:hypothetical protein